MIPSLSKIAVYSWLGLFALPAFAQSTGAAVFVTNNVGDSVTSFMFDDVDGLSFVSVTPTGEGPQAISLTPDGRYLAVGHGTISETFEELRIFEVQSDATIVEVLNVLVPDSPLDLQWLSNNLLAVCETSLSDDNNLNVYRFDAADQSLEIVDTEFTGDFSYSIATARENSLVFTNNTFGTASISTFTRSGDGELEPVSVVSVEPLFVIALGTSPDGQFLYGAGGISGTRNEILSFEITDEGDILQLPGAQSPGNSPKVIGISDDGNILVAGHGTDSTVQSFLRDQKSGEIIPTGFSYDVGSQGNLGDLAVAGDVMFVTDEATFDDGVRGLLAFRINPDGSFTQIGSIVDSQGGRPEYIAVWRGQDQFVLGDVNQDGKLNLLDVAHFVDLVLAGQFQAEADINQDGEVNLLDVDPFINLLLG